MEVEFIDGTFGPRIAPELQDAAAAFPREFVLSAATREVGRSHPLLITRLIEVLVPSVSFYVLLSWLYDTLGLFADYRVRYLSRA